MANDEAGGESAFILVAPPWLLVEPGKADGFRLTDVILVPPKDPKGGRLLPLFTDDDLARRYVAGGNKKDAGYEPVQLGNLAELLELLVQFRALGVSHVAIDPGSGYCHPRTIQSVIDALVAPS